MIPGRKKWQASTYCEMIVAMAAPLTPSFNVKIRIGSKTMLTRFPATAISRKEDQHE